MTWGRFNGAVSRSICTYVRAGDCCPNVIYLTVVQVGRGLLWCVLTSEVRVARQPPVVLLVNDHQDSADMYAIGLLAMGFQPVTSPTAEEGFERALRMQPDVVVADVGQEVMSGVDLTRRLRGDPRTRGAGIIVLTSHVLGGVKDRAEAAGCDRFLVKPCLPDVLALEIRDVLHRRQEAT
jgi:two-component system cell cycle response regulator DivK